jgi:anti-sigma factor RsiW
MNCMAEGTLRAYRDQELGDKERREVERHLEECATCRSRAAELEKVASRVGEHLLSLGTAENGRGVDARVALANFKARHEGAEENVSLLGRIFVGRWRPAWVVGATIAIVAAFLSFPPARSLAQRFLETLRVEKVQPVRIDTSALEGNRTLQQMIEKMVSDKVVVTVDEKEQQVADVSEAARLAGFHVQLPSARADMPRLTVEGQHAFNMTIDRARLQDVFNQAGRSDLVLPGSLDGAMLAVQIPRGVRAQYGTCPQRNEDGESESREARQFKSCLILIEAPSPLVSVPSDLNIEELAEIGLQLAGMSPAQAKEFCQTINWKSTLVLPLPRYVESYDVVDVNGVQGTLVNNPGGRGLRYALIWVKGGMVYSLLGFGDSGDAVSLADSLN